MKHLPSLKEKQCLPALGIPLCSVKASQYFPVKPYWKNVTYSNNQQFTILQELKLSNLSYEMSSIWWDAEGSSETDPYLKWGGERDLKYHFKLLWDDISRLNPAYLRSDFYFSDHISACHASYSFFPDFQLCKLIENDNWSIEDFKTLAFVEILCPSTREQDKDTDCLSDNKLVQSVTSRMMQLHVLFDIPDVMVLVTNYNQWKIFWTKSTNWLINAISLETIQAARDHEALSLSEKFSESLNLEFKALDFEIAEKHLSAANPTNFVAETEETGRAEANEERNFEICSTKTYYYNDPTIVELLANFFTKIKYVRQSPVSSLFSRLIDTTRKHVKYALVDEKDYIWTCLPMNLELKLSFSVNSKSFYLLHELNDGRDGRTWLGCSPRGHLCILKFGNGNSGRYIAKEAKAWYDVWNVPAYDIILAKYNKVLVMPFCFAGCFLSKTGTPFFTNLKSIGNKGNAPIIESNEDCVNQNNFILDFSVYGTVGSLDSESFLFYLKNPLKAAENAITNMVQNGYKHNDLKWAHVALLPQFDEDSKLIKAKPILIDLFDIRKIIETDEDKDTIITEGMKKIEENVLKIQEIMLLSNSKE
jgi:hypothetical protein